MMGLTNSTSIRAAIIWAREYPLKGLGVKTEIDLRSEDTTRLSIDSYTRCNKRRPVWWLGFDNAMSTYYVFFSWISSLLESDNTSQSFTDSLIVVTVLLGWSPDAKSTLVSSDLPPFTTFVSITNVGFTHAPSQSSHTRVSLTNYSLVPFGQTLIHVKPNRK